MASNSSSPRAVLVGLGKRFLASNHKRTSTHDYSRSSHKLPAAAAACTAPLALSTRSLHSSDPVYDDKNLDDDHSPPAAASAAVVIGPVSLVPDDVINESSLPPDDDKYSYSYYWTPHPLTGVFSPPGHEHLHMEGGGGGKRSSSSVLDQKVFFRSVENLEI